LPQCILFTVDGMWIACLILTRHRFSCYISYRRGVAVGPDGEHAAGGGAVTGKAPGPGDTTTV